MGRRHQDTVLPIKDMAHPIKDTDRLKGMVNRRQGTVRRPNGNKDTIRGMIPLAVMTMIPARRPRAMAAPDVGMVAGSRPMTMAASAQIRTMDGRVIR